MARMKKAAQILLLVLVVGMLAACGKDKPANTVADGGNITQIPKTETQNPETDKTEAGKAENDTTETDKTEAGKAENDTTETDKAEAGKAESDTTETDKSETDTPEAGKSGTDAPANDNPEAAENEITDEVLSRVYSDYIVQAVRDCYTPDELVFTVADINNDGIRELLYAESNVNAAGVYVCFYTDGKIIQTGPFGCYGGIKYAPAEGKIISVMDNNDYMRYELISIGAQYEQDTEHTYAIEPDSDYEGYVFFLDDEEVTESVYADAFKELQSMDVKSLDYYDMYMYGWCNSTSDTICERLGTMLAGDEASRESHMIIPMVEKAKLIGTWQLYSSEIEGEITYAGNGGDGGLITVHEDYTVDLDYGRHKMSGMMMEFHHGAFNDYADNTDWYVVIYAAEEDGTTIYMNVSEDDRLTVNTIGEGETLISLWDIYTRIK